MRSRRRDGCDTCGSALKYSFPVIVARSRVHAQAYKVADEREVLLSLTERKRIEDYHSHFPNTPPRSPQTSPKPPPPSADSSEEKREPKALPAFHPLPYYSFIPAVLVMVLRLALDVLTKLLNWQKWAVVMVMVSGGGGGGSCLGELQRGVNETREPSMRMFEVMKRELIRRGVSTTFCYKLK